MWSIRGGEVRRLARVTDCLRRRTVCRGSRQGADPVDPGDIRSEVAAECRAGKGRP